jgi:hypothetical protein
MKNSEAKGVETKSEETTATAPNANEKTYTQAEFDAALSGANTRIKELETAQRMRDAKVTVTEALTKAGARSTELIWLALQGDLKFDDKGNLTNMESLVKDFTTNHPEQFGIEKPTETVNGGAGGPSSTSITLDQISRMSPKEINSSWDQVKNVLNRGT